MLASLVRATVGAVSKRKLQPTPAALTLTPSAVNKIKQLLKDKPEQGGLKVGVRTRGPNIPGWSPTLGSQLHGESASPSDLLLFHALFLSLKQINKTLKKKKKKKKNRFLSSKFQAFFQSLFASCFS
uniref:Uncharacterized protein n=1 Tax=Neovison vison TaxID=452646 RepID=A0A8C7EN91_NEOVI